jgi:CubicO group peptidase (beta-lactamase class C family)
LVKPVKERGVHKVISSFSERLLLVHPANEYASFQKLFHPCFLEDDPKGFSSIPRLPVWSFQGVTEWGTPWPGPPLEAPVIELLIVYPVMILWTSPSFTLMKPLGITGFRWGYSPKGRAWLGGNAIMRPRDMLKFGQMCLNEGVWQNRRIVSDAWLSESTRCHVLSEYGMEYGYLWWRGRQTISGRHIEAFWAQGNGGQVIFVCPERDRAWLKRYGI